jgi:hypothetical protein
VAAKITRDLVEGYLHCKFKSHLRLAGEQGTRSDYEGLLIERRADVRLRAVDKILTRHQEGEVARNVPLAAAALKAGPLFVLDAGLGDDLVSLHFDGRKRAGRPGGGATQPAITLASSVAPDRGVWNGRPG